MRQKLMAIVLSVGFISGIGIVSTGNASAAAKPAPKPAPKPTPKSAPATRFPTVTKAPISSPPSVVPTKRTDSQNLAKTIVQLIPVLGSYLSFAIGTPTPTQAKVINSVAVGAVGGALTGGVGALVYGFVAGATVTTSALTAAVVSGAAVGATGAALSQSCKINRVVKAGLC